MQRDLKGVAKGAVVDLDGAAIDSRVEPYLSHARLKRPMGRNGSRLAPDARGSLR